MAGSWLCLVQGFAGVRVRPAGLFLAPNLPEALGELRFRLHYQQRLLEITVQGQQARCQLISGAPLTLYLHDQAITISQGATL
ncbi:glycosyl hydrolase family 65 protein [Alishewanella longhuensis]